MIVSDWTNAVRHINENIYREELLKIVHLNIRIDIGKFECLTSDTQKRKGVHTSKIKRMKLPSNTHSLTTMETPVPIKTIEIRTSATNICNERLTHKNLRRPPSHYTQVRIERQACGLRRDFS